jgi:hypothetical protein
LTTGVLDWDEGREEAEVRLYAIARGHSVRFLKPLRYKRMSRPLADSADEVGRWVVSGGVELLIVSPVNRALRAANGDPGSPVFELYEVLREFGTTNILIDHVVGAAIEKEATREYGSVAKRDAARGSWSVYEQSASPGSRVVVLRNTKPDSLAPKLAPEAVRIEFEPHWPDLAGTYERISFHPDEVMQRDDAREETRVEKLVRILKRYGPTMGTTELCTLSGFDAKHLKDIARRARGAGFHVSGRDDSWTLVLPEDNQ